jgi:hypothetical protein
MFLFYEKACAGAPKMARAALPCNHVSGDGFQAALLH